MNRRALVALVLFLAPACGSSDPRALTDAGSRALNSGDYSAAAQSYEQALATLGVTDPDWKRAKMGLFQARAHLDPARAKDVFLEFAKANPTQVTDADFALIGRGLVEVNGPGAIWAAIELLLEGKKTYKDSRALDALATEIFRRAESSSDSDKLEYLKMIACESAAPSVRN